MNVYLFDKKSYKELPYFVYGVYMFLDERHNPLYIGKAVNIKNRIQNHFNGNTNTRSYCDNFHEVIAVITRNCESVESALISLYNPKYNKYKLLTFKDSMDNNMEFEKTLKDINRLIGNEIQLSMVI